MHSSMKLETVDKRQRNKQNRFELKTKRRELLITHHRPAHSTNDWINQNFIYSNWCDNQQYLSNWNTHTQYLNNTCVSVKPSVEYISKWKCFYVSGIHEMISFGGEKKLWNDFWLECIWKHVGASEPYVVLLLLI